MQHRRSLVLEFWNRGGELTVANIRYRNFVRGFLTELLRNDAGANDLTTSSLIKKNKKASAIIVAKENGMLAGVEEFKFLNSDLEISAIKKDGGKIKNGDALLEISGDAGKILGRERVSLNLLQRMSGIATLASGLDKKLRNKAKLAATRKTLWGLLDKKAVSVGHGLTHRLGLSDLVLIKDNHLKLLGGNIEKAISLAINKSKYIEIEVEDGKQALKAANAIKLFNKNGHENLFAILLDKLRPDDIILIIKELKKQNLYENILFEASGNINPQNLIGYADCGIDVVSMGCLTNSAKSLDISLEVK